MQQSDDRSLASDLSASQQSAIESNASLDKSVRGSGESEGGGENPVGEGEAEEDVITEPNEKSQYEQTKRKYDQLIHQNLLIQGRIIDEFQGIQVKDANAASTSDTSNYRETLKKFLECRSDLEKMRSEFSEELDTLSRHCSEADTHRMEKEDEFHRIREQAGKDSIMQRTNKPIRNELLSTKESLLFQKENELENTRIGFIRTKAKHKQADDDLNQQDQLSEGLHLIDFEQLKIENQSLNEKQSEKSQDLVKIKQKIEINAHTLTHVKEKLWFVTKQKEKLRKEQEDIDRQYTESRNTLAESRIRRDKVRDDNSDLKKSSGLIGMTDLLYDFENRSNELELMQDKVTELKTRFNDLMAMQHELEAKIAQRRPLDPNLLKMNR